MTDLDRDELEMPAEESMELPPLSADEIKAVILGSQALQQALDAEPSLPTQVEVIVREHTRKDVTRDTLRIIIQSLELYLPPPALEYLLNLLITSDDPRIIEQAEVHAAAETWAWLRRMVALYGSAMREANAVSNANPDSWRVVNRRAFFDAVSGNWGVTLEIVKYNGERIFLDEVPGSALFLASAVVDTLNSIPPEVAPEILPEEDVMNFMEQCVILSELFAPGALAEWAQGMDDELDEDWEN